MCASASYFSSACWISLFTHGPPECCLSPAAGAARCCCPRALCSVRRHESTAYPRARLRHVIVLLLLLVVLGVSAYAPLGSCRCDVSVGAAQAPSTTGRERNRWPNQLPATLAGTSRRHRSLCVRSVSARRTRHSQAPCIPGGGQLYAGGWASCWVPAGRTAGTVCSAFVTLNVAGSAGPRWRSQDPPSYPCPGQPLPRSLSPISSSVTRLVRGGLLLGGHHANSLGSKQCRPRLATRRLASVLTGKPTLGIGASPAARPPQSSTLVLPSPDSAATCVSSPSRFTEAWGSKRKHIEEALAAAIHCLTRPHAPNYQLLPSDLHEHPTGRPQESEAQPDGADSREKPLRTQRGSSTTETREMTALTSSSSAGDAFALSDALARASEYSLLGVGKRVRPLLCLITCQMLGGTLENCLPTGKSTWRPQRFSAAIKVARLQPHTGSTRRRHPWLRLLLPLATIDYMLFRCMYTYCCLCAREQLLHWRWCTQ
eukprot:GHVT01087370.1.p1 GENE.GHVT01087370.1~~GHVT01087370.1.p1  ORF type:complete len:486 (+),score=55.38 GHVT01087370.1:1787-3244(+)